MKIAIIVLGAIFILLGGLWLLQGLGLVHMAPILCVADCAPIEGASPTWTIIGFLLAAVGLAAIWFAIRRPRS